MPDELRSVSKGTSGLAAGSPRCWRITLPADDETGELYLFRIIIKREENTEEAIGKEIKRDKTNYTRLGLTDSNDSAL